MRTCSTSLFLASCPKKEKKEKENQTHYSYTSVIAAQALLQIALQSSKI
jgi:hypothetical protein